MLERIGNQAYRLHLPEKYYQQKLHDVFPIQFIEEYKPRENQPIPLLPDLEQGEEFVIEEVKDKAGIGGKPYYLIKWEGWPTEYNQWVAEEDMGDAKKAIQRYEKLVAKKAKKAKQT